MWTEQEINSIKNHFPMGNIDIIAEETGRSISAIKIKANRIGIYLLPKINLWYKDIPVEIRAYLAGHFDGEGCAFFRKKDNTRLTRTPCLSVSNAHLPCLKLYQEYFKGKIVDVKSGTNKKMYAWRCTKYEDVYNFILSTIQYSIEKKEQLLLIKEFIDLRMNEGKTISFSDEFRDKAEELHKKCTALKNV